MPITSVVSRSQTIGCNAFAFQYGQNGRTVADEDESDGRRQFAQCLDGTEHRLFRRVIASHDIDSSLIAWWCLTAVKNTH